MHAWRVLLAFVALRAFALRLHRVRLRLRQLRCVGCLRALRCVRLRLRLRRMRLRLCQLRCVRCVRCVRNNGNPA